MKPFWYEVLLAILLFIAIILFAFFLFRFRSMKKDTTTVSIALVTVTLIDAFIIIHLFFCYQWGFPASISQDNAKDLTLGAADWLSFLSGYLSFAGSLVMAYLVYRQTKKIDRLTLSEYQPSVSLLIQKTAKSTDYPNFAVANIIQYIPEQPLDQYYTYHCDLVETNNECEDFSILLFVEITNNSKATIKKLSFLSIELQDTQDRNQKILYKNRGNNWDPADSITEILPGSKLKRCFLMNKIPKSLGINWMTFNFLHGDSDSISTKTLVSKSSNYELTFLNGMNSSND